MLVMAAAATLTSQATGYKYETVEGDKMATRIYTLDNGLKVYLSVNKEKPRIQTYIAVRTGSRNDPAETTGLAHYLEHIMFKGTKALGTTDAQSEAPLLDNIEALYEQYRHTTDSAQRRAIYHTIDSVSQVAARYNIPNEYDKMMAAIGSEGSNAYTSLDETVYQENIPSNEVDNWARIQADRFQNMVIRGFHTELEAVYEEYNIGLGSDFRKAYYAMNALLFPNHPYGAQTTIGTQAHLKNPSITNIKEYFHRYYVPNNVAICMAGDLDCDKVIATIDKYFGSWQASTTLSRPEFAPLRPIAAVKDTTVVGNEAEKVFMAWRFDGAASLQCDTLNVVAKMLSNGTAGLFDIGINQKMRCLGVQAGTEEATDYSALMAVGAPKEGQSLDEVKDLILEQIAKLKRGDFDDDLLQSVKNNIKLQYNKDIEGNSDRAMMFVNTFIGRKDWAQEVGGIDRINAMTKQQITDFANRYLNDNYVIVYKRIGIDSTQKKIDKPAITPIPANSDEQSQLASEILSTATEPIQPHFVDFSKDMQQATTKRGLPLLYVENKENGLFNLTYHYEIGTENDKWLPTVLGYLTHLGTGRLTAEQINQQMYSLAVSLDFSFSANTTDIHLSGLNESLPQAVTLLDDILANAQTDKSTFSLYVDNIMKNRADSKLDQKECFWRLAQYGIQGSRNAYTNIPDSAELATCDP